VIKKRGAKDTHFSEVVVAIKLTEDENSNTILRCALD
jgi:hypothetical protein